MPVSTESLSGLGEQIGNIQEADDKQLQNVMLTGEQNPNLGSDDGTIQPLMCVSCYDIIHDDANDGLAQVNSHNCSVCSACRYHPGTCQYCEQDFKC